MYQNYNIYNPFFVREETDSEIISLTQAIQLIRESINEEKNDQSDYEKLIMMASNDLQRSVLSMIREDEVKHQKILQEVYYKLMNNSNINNQFNNDQGMNNSFYRQENDYKNKLQEAMLGEIKAAKKYRRILAAMPDKESYALIFSIVTDEMLHATMFSFLVNSL